MKYDIHFPAEIMVQFQPAVVDYLKTFKEKETFQSRLKKLTPTLQEKLEEELEEFIDPTSLEVMNVPVSVQGELCDLSTVLTLLANGNGYAQVPVSRYHFIYSDIQPAGRDKNRINTLFEKTEAQQTLLNALVQKGFSHIDEYQYKEAIACFRAATEQQHPGGWYGLALLHRLGSGVDKNLEEAEKLFTLIRRTAENGNVLAQYYLGNMYEHGFGVPRNRQEAVKYYEQTAEEGIVEAMYTLGFKYLSPRAIIDYGLLNDHRANFFKWLQRAAELGHTKAQDELVVSTLTLSEALQCKTEGKFDLAMCCFQRIAEQKEDRLSSLQGCYHLACMYEEGYRLAEVPEDEQEKYRWAHAQYWYQQAIARCKHQDPAWLERKEVVDAQYRLGRLYEQNHAYHGSIFIRMRQGAAIRNLAQPQNDFGEPINNQLMAEKLYQTAADNRHAEAQYIMGQYYQRKNQFELAHHYYQLATDNGHDAAPLITKTLCASIADHDYVAALYITGQYYDHKNQSGPAHHYYQLAANNGHVEAQYMTGQCYERKGQLGLAHRYYQLAADNGHDAEGKALARLSAEVRQKLDDYADQKKQHNKSALWRPSDKDVAKAELARVLSRKLAGEERNRLFSKKEIALILTSDTLKALLSQEYSWVIDKLHDEWAEKSPVQSNAQRVPVRMGNSST